MFQRSSTSSKAALIIAILAGAAVLGLAPNIQAQMVPDAAGEATPDADAKPGKGGGPKIKVGTYDPERAFQQHPSYDDLMQAVTSAQEGMQKAQEEGQQEDATRVQQQYEQQRNRIIEEFRTDVTENVPEAAEKTGVQIVADEIVYAGENVDTKDITDDLIEAFGGEAEEPEPSFQMPQD